MANQRSSNPYHPHPDDGDGAAPFAGRHKAFEFLYQRLTDPAGTESSLILGRRDSGKTALLHHFSRYFDETFLGVYIPLKDTALKAEADWLRLLADGATRALTERNYTLSRLPEFTGAGVDMRGWLGDTFLPELFSIIRRQRRLVFLLDDADALLNAIAEGRLPDDSIAYLHALIGAQPQLGLVLTLDSQFEADISRFSPLIALDAVFRLANLSEDESIWLLTEPAAALYRLTPDAAAAAYRATGGQPRPLQRFGYHLFKRWEAHPDRTTLTPDDVKPVTLTVYAESEADLRAAWDRASRNERLVLTAIISLLYADPLGTITPAGIESWLVETDYPLDGTAINAAIRGLEYQEIAESTAGGIRLTAGLMQTWLLENGRLSGRAPQAEARRPGLRWLALAAAALLVIVLVLVAGQGTTPATTDTPAPVPTVTLVANP